MEKAREREKEKERESVEAVSRRRDAWQLRATALHVRTEFRGSSRLPTDVNHAVKSLISTIACSQLNF